MSPSRKRALRVVRGVSRVMDYLVLILSLLLLFVAGYAFWDTHQVFQVASSEQYALYKPHQDDRLSFDELKARNGDLRAWITVYGTKIDYPIVQGRDNTEYLNKTVLGEFSTAGSIFLHYRNSEDFSDYQNILYGHYMAERKMFGDMELFREESFFDSHRYGQLDTVDGKRWGIEFFAFLETVGSDQELLSPAKKAADKQQLIQHIYEMATYKRELEFGEQERLLLLDTCDLSKTNGRYMLVGRLTDELYDNPYPEEESSGNGHRSDLVDAVAQVPIFFILLPIWLLLLLIYGCYRYYRRSAKREEVVRNEQENA